jgi:hypothetical protein
LAGQPESIELGNLPPNSTVYYQFAYTLPDGKSGLSEIRSFHTQRRGGEPFSFAIQADSHLDVSSNPRVYAQTLTNVLGAKPDFLIDLGDTTMVDKFGKFYTRAESQYLAQRYYLGRIAHSIPILLALGNHDGEDGTRLSPDNLSMPVWSATMRKKFFPNPEPGGIYTGNVSPMKGVGLLQDYAAWEWGNALFVILDPFWYTQTRKGDDNWSRTLGEQQYRWLAKTLAASKAACKFVFVHHLAGGVRPDARGGIAAARYAEWGGRNADGSDGFAAHRPGWEMPIHPLLVKYGVSAVFHGHDHLYAKEELDGVIYQEVPQPSHPGGGTHSAVEYGYEGQVLASSGYLLVSVGPAAAKVDYVRTTVPSVTADQTPNGAAQASYIILPSR